jgi:sugar phosphate isomerase/epimerase
MGQSRIAAQLYTLREFMKTPADIAASLKKVREIGYEAVQVSGIGPIDKKELRKILDSEGLVCAATHIGFPEMRDQMDKTIEEHKILGCTQIAPGSMPGDYQKDAAGYIRFAKEASEVAAKLKEKGGLTWSYHNHSFELVKLDGKKTGMDLLFENSDKKLFNFEIDTYWITHGGSSPASWIRKVKGRIPLVHFKDMVVRRGEKGVEQIMAEVGEGNLDWPEILKACKAAGVEWYFVEQDSCQRNPFESLAMSFKNMKAWGLK